MVSPADLEPSRDKPAGEDSGGVDALPSYARLIEARHTAHRPELAQIVADLPIRSGDRVLDVACGDGFHSQLLADRLGDVRRLTAVDISQAYVRQFQQRFEAAPTGSTPQLLLADAYHLPLAADTIDLAWCAQSFMSLREPADVLREVRRVLRPGGLVVILENDELHDVILPWPATVEMAVHSARREALLRQGESEESIDIGRHLQEVVQTAGLIPRDKQTWTVDRRAPLSSADRAFLQEYLEMVRRDVASSLDPEMVGEVHALIDSRHPDYLPDRPEFEMTASYVVFFAEKPS